MSTLAYSYSEPYKLPAGILALVVHGAFFALLYFGVNWRTDQPQGVTVDIWNALPAQQVASVKVTSVNVEPPPVVPPKPVALPKVAEPLPPPKADIELAEKKKPKIKPPETKPVVKIENPPPKSKQITTKISNAEMAQQAEQEGEARVGAAQAAAAAAAITNEVGKYIGLITAKIRRNIVMPPDVPDNVQAEFKVILIPGGSVLSAKLTKPSGSAVYDDAVERAIMKAQPLPLPPDVSLFNRFRELHLTFRPKEKE